MNRALSRTLRFGVTALIAAALVVFARTIDWRESWENIVQANWGILWGAVAVNLACLVVKGVRWWIFLRPAGAPSLGLATRATFAGAGLNNILIANDDHRVAHAVEMLLQIFFNLVNRGVFIQVN
jgi:uncharacterized membrane protein YbhN (UPF0104 family)